MQNIVCALWAKFLVCAKQDEGQDLVEYALVVALIALGATAGMSSLATNISSAFTSIGGSVSGAI
jgi:pilus assembly protein Flp/PilA